MNEYCYQKPTIKNVLLIVGTPQTVSNSLDSGIGSQPMDVDMADHPIQTTPIIEKTSQACKRPFIPSTSPKLGKHSRTSENDKVC